MNVRYELTRAAHGWEVSENGETLAVREDFREALYVVDLLVSAAKAAGGSAAVLVDDGAPPIIAAGLTNPNAMIMRTGPPC